MKPKLKRWNKDGTFLADAFTQLFSYIGLALVIILFSLLFSIRSCSSDGIDRSIIADIEPIGIHVDVANFLRTQLPSGQTVANAIVVFCSTQNDEALRETIMEAGSRAITDPLFGIAVVCPANREIIIKSAACFEPETLVLPSPDGLIAVNYCVQQPYVRP